MDDQKTHPSSKLRRPKYQPLLRWIKRPTIPTRTVLATLLHRLILVLLIAGGVTSAAAMTTSKSKEQTKTITPTAPLQQSYVWHDGDTKRTVWINPSVVAEFRPSALEQSPVKRALGQKATTVSNEQPFVRFWRLTELTSDLALEQVKSRFPESRLSPVFHDSPSEASRKRALPGNVIVFFKPSWEGPQVNRWVASRGLRVVKKLAIGPQVYVIQTEPGLASLKAANEIYESGEVVAAMPDWWEEVATR